MKPRSSKEWFAPRQQWYRFHVNNDPDGIRLEYYNLGARDTWLHLRNVHEHLVDMIMKISQQNHPINTENTEAYNELKKALSAFYPEIDSIIKRKK